MANEEKITELIDVVKIQQQINVLITGLKEAIALMSKLSTGVSSAGSGVSQSEGIKATTNAYREQQNVQKQGQAILTELSEKEKQLIVNAGTLARLKKEFKSQLEGEVSEYKKLSNQYTSALKKAKDLGAAVAGGNKSLAGAYTEAAKHAGELNNKLKNIDASLGNHQRNVGNYKSALGGMKESLIAVGGALGVAFGVEEIIAFGKESYKLYQEQLQQEKLLSNALGKRGDVGKLLQADVTSMKERFQVTDATIISVQKLGAAQGLSLEQIRKLTEATFQWASVTGDDVNSSAEKMLATYNGVTRGLKGWIGDTSNLTKEQLKNGAVVDMVIDKYKGYAEASVTSEQRASLAWEEFSKGFGKALTKIGSGLASTGEKTGIEFDKMGEGVVNFLLKWNMLSTTVRGIYSLIDGVKNLFTDFSGTIEKIGESVGGFFTGMYEQIMKLFTDPKQALIDLKDGLLDFVGMGKEAESTVSEINKAFINVVNKNMSAYEAEKMLNAKMKGLLDSHVITNKQATDAINLFWKKVAEAKTKASEGKPFEEEDTRKDADMWQLRIDVMMDSYAKEAEAEEKRYQEALKASIHSHKALELEEEKHQKILLELREKWGAKLMKQWEDRAIAEDKISKDQQKKQQEDSMAIMEEGEKMDDYFNVPGVGLVKYEDYIKQRDKKAEEDEKQKEEDEKLRDARFEFTKETLQSGFDIFKSFQDKKIMELDSEAAADKEAKDKELAQTGLTEQQRDEIEAKYALKDDEREKKKRKIAHDTAVANKAIAIASIMLSTAQAVMKSIAEFPLTFGQPWVSFEIAMGALQLAVAASTPIPKLAKGRKGGKAGFAIVGDAGVERIDTLEGSYLTPDKPTLTYLPEGADVIPNDKLFDLPNIEHSFAHNVQNSFELNAVVNGLASLERTVKNKRETYWIGTERGFKAITKQGNSITEYINKNVAL